MIPKKARCQKTERRQQEEYLDELWSEVVRKEAMRSERACLRCHTPKQSYKELQAAHRFTRNCRTTRWSAQNGAGLCGACHMYIDNHEDAKRELFTRLLGEEEYQNLYILAHMTTKSRPVDLKMTEIALKMMIKELNSCCTTTL